MAESASVGPGASRVLQQFVLPSSASPWSPTLIDWTAILTTIGSTATIVAILGYFGKGVFDHALTRRLDVHKARLKQEGDLVVEGFKVDAQRALQAQQATFASELERMKVNMAAEAKRQDHIRAEIRAWANPILGAVRDLRFRLINVIEDNAYPQLAAGGGGVPGWNISHDYFLVSTVYYFCQYFCWTHLLEEQLSFELFEKHAAKDAFFAELRVVGECLSRHPPDRLGLADAPDDRQVFRLQQRFLGELVAVEAGERGRCMRYRDFALGWRDEDFRSDLTPIVAMVEGLKPGSLRWARLDLMRERLEVLENRCEALLELPREQGVALERERN